MVDKISLKEEQISTKDIFNGRILHVVEDGIRLPNGDESIREVIRHIGAVCVIPVFEDRTVVMERQYRYAVDKVMLEIPAGKLDSPDEDRLDAIKRELMEETGYTADNWIDMGIYYGTPAYSDEKITMYLATGLHAGEQKLDDDEFLEVERIPLDDLVEKVLSGEIEDGKTQIAVLKANALLGRGV